MVEQARAEEKNFSIAADLSAEEQRRAPGVALNLANALYLRDRSGWNRSI